MLNFIDFAVEFDKMLHENCQIFPQETITNNKAVEELILVLQHVYRLKLYNSEIIYEHFYFTLLRIITLIQTTWRSILNNKTTWTFASTPENAVNI